MEVTKIQRVLSRSRGRCAAVGRGRFDMQKEESMAHAGPDLHTTQRSPRAKDDPQHGVKALQVG